MKSLRIERTAAARKDVLDGFIYIAERHYDSGVRFVTAVRRDVRRLAEMPGMGARREPAPKRLSGLRSLPVTGFRNYLIFYRVVRDTLVVHRVLHGARDLRQALGE